MMNDMIQTMQRENLIADLFPGFEVTDWMLSQPGGFEDLETGEYVSAGQPMYFIRVVKINAWPDGPKGKTAVASAICVPVSDIEANEGNIEAIAELIETQVDICRVQLMDWFSERGLEFPK